MRRFNGFAAIFVLVLIYTVLFSSVQAESLYLEMPAEEQIYETDDLADSNQLAEDFIRSIMSSRGRSMLKSRRQRELNLTGATAKLYSLLVNDIIDVANGNRSSTEMEYDVAVVFDQTVYTKDDLHVESIVIENQFNPDALSAIQSVTSFDLNAMMTELLSRYPYELYWYDKTAGISSLPSFRYSTDGESITISGTVTIRLAVSADYSLDGDQYAYDTSYGQSAQAAAAKASRIVVDYVSASDEAKLRGYAAEICALASYNNEAAAGGVPYGNPWQLVWVFDENPNTNVVCEGYSKAFQYLCDLSTFSGDIGVITVTGTMTGGTGAGPHMWNVVHLNDGCNYLVDVTNIDEGTIGYPNQLMLVKSSSGNVDDGYSFITSGGMIAYVYDSGTKSQYTASELTLSDISDENVVAIDETSFPDDAFRAYITDNFDLNHDNLLDESECTAVTSISVPEMGIESLKGIENFPNLNYLLAWYNSISEINVSHNTALSYLYLDANQISSIDVSILPNLYYLYMDDNPLTEIDVSHNNELESLHVSYTQVSEIDVSHNPELKMLECQATQITELDVTHNPKLIQLICQVVHISSIDLSNNPSLTSLWISYTDLSSLDVSANTNLQQLFCAENQIACLDLSNNPNITDLRASEICIVLPPNTTTYDMTLFDGFIPERSSSWEGAQFNYETGLVTNIKDTFVRYKYDCGNSHSIDVTLYLTDTIAVNSETFPDPVFRQYIIDNFAPDALLTTSQQLYVGDITIDNMNISSLQGIEFFPNLANLRCSGNPISQLVLSSHNLLNLFITNTQISSLDIGSQPNLSFLDISSCPIQTIDLSLFPKLHVLYCDNTELTSLNIQVCPALEFLSCSSCHIPEIDLTGLSVNTNSAVQYLNNPIPVIHEDGYYIIDISNLVTNLSRVSFPDSLSYDPISGIAKFDFAPTDTIHYLYDTGNPDYTFEVFCMAKIIDHPYDELSTVIVPSSTRRIESEAFAGIGAEVIIIPDGCEYVATDAFDNCENLVYIVNRSTMVINVPDGVTLISE